MNCAHKVFIFPALLLLIAVNPGLLHAQFAKPAWSPEQATGAPDTFEAGDLVTAWASLSPDEGDEWLELEYEKSVPVDSVRIFETYNPGAISKVSAFDEANNEITLWEGIDTTHSAPEAFEVRGSLQVNSKRIKVYLNSRLVPGWNEIDAVELVGLDGSRQWAIKADASSTFAVPRIKKVKVTLENQPPTVVLTLPQGGSLEVDPDSTDEILVQFSKEMKTQAKLTLGRISFDSAPEVTGPIQFIEDKRTCVIPVKLAPGRTYALWVNNAGGEGFQDGKNNWAIPYLLVFKTKGEPIVESSDPSAPVDESVDADPN